MKQSAIPKSKAKTAYGLLSEIRALILAEPLRYDQRETLTIIPAIYRQSGDEERVPACGTIGCVAGWVTALKSRRPASVWTLGYATKKLGLSVSQSNGLFHGGAAGGTASQTREHAEAGAAHIAKFQKKYRAQLLAKKV